MQTVNKDSNDFREIRSKGYVYVDKTARQFKGGAAVPVK